ncbi:hypothetical protein GCM10027442_36500 [Emticicia fontis]
MYNKLILVIIVYSLVTRGFDTNERNNRNNQVSNIQVKAEDFNTFLKRFCTEKDFQLSRIKYPLTSKYYEIDTDKPTIKITQKGEWEFSDLIRKDYIKKVSRKHSKKYILNITIDETGVDVNYIFELINGKWFLTTTIDHST